MPQRRINIGKRVNVNDLFSEIRQFCSIPFNRIEPLSPDSLDNSNETKFQLKDSKKSKLSYSYNTKLPKTRSEVEILFTEINAFCKINLPFKLSDLETVDRIEESSITNQIVQVSRTKRKRLPLKSYKLDKNHQVNAFANLLYDFDTKLVKNYASEEKLEKPIKDKIIEKPLLNVKCNKEVIQNSKQIPSFTLSSCDLKSNLKSCRSYFNLVKKNEASTEEKPGTLKKRKNANRKNKNLLKDDSLESGYSSSQSSVPSPCSLVATDLGESNKSSSSSTSISLNHNINPDGKIIYLLSQYDFYLNKTKTKRKASVSCENEKTAKLIYNCKDTHHKVIEWQCKTLHNNCCSTPEHDHFEETPPNSPERTNWQSDNTINANSKNLCDDDPIDFDCLHELFTSTDENLDDIDLMLQPYNNNNNLNLDFYDSFDIDSILR